VSEWVFGVDASFDELTLDEARRLKAAGVQVYTQCLWTGAVKPASRIASLRNAQGAGLKLIGYISVAPGRMSGREHVGVGRLGVPDDLWSALVKVPIDVELEGLEFERHVLEALDRVAELGKPRDVYTAHFAWAGFQGNPTRPAGVGLWNAFWDEQPDVDFARFPFGGWSSDEVWGEQWSGGHVLEGQLVDRNTFRAAALGLPEPPAELEGEMRIIGEPGTVRAYLVVGRTAFHIPDGATWNDLRALIYGEPPHHGPDAHQVRPETWAWLQANGVIAGLGGG
jgi:hypothetical protein